jgi:hypothetical protein
VVDQGADTTHEVLLSACPVTGDGLGSLERESAAKGSQAPEERLLTGRK